MKNQKIQEVENKKKPKPQKQDYAKASLFRRGRERLARYYTFRENEQKKQKKITRI